MRYSNTKLLRSSSTMISAVVITGGASPHHEKIRIIEVVSDYLTLQLHSAKLCQDHS